MVLSCHVHGLLISLGNTMCFPWSMMAEKIDTQRAECNKKYKLTTKTLQRHNSPLTKC